MTPPKRSQTDQLPPEFFANVGANIRRRREELGLAQVDAAMRIWPEGTRRYGGILGDYESGRTAMSLARAVQIARALEFTLSELLRQPGEIEHADYHRGFRAGWIDAIQHLRASVPSANPSEEHE